MEVQWLIDEAGKLCCEMGRFEEELKVFDTGQTVQSVEVERNDMEDVENALVLGLRDYFKKSSFQRAVIGLSGGIDSALTLVLAAKALGAENVVAVMMPSEFSSQHSVDDSRQLCENLGCQCESIAIHELYDTFNRSLAPMFEGREFDITEENLQARIRGTLLMAISE